MMRDYKIWEELPKELLQIINSELAREGKIKKK